MSGPLEGVRVIDMTNVVMGPYATRILGDLGADVIKIEPRAGDNTRRLGPERHKGMGHYFLNLNRNKRSLVLDLKHPSGLEAFGRLVERADVLVSNIRPQALRRLGVAYETMRGRNPRIIYLNLVGYDQAGPRAAKPAYDDLMQAAVGIPALTARAGGDAPRYAPLNMGDRTVGLAGVNAVLAALFYRERTGEGQAVEVPMFETMADFVLAEHMGGLAFDPPTGPSGYARTLTRHRTPFPTRDGYLSAQIYNDKHWNAFFAACGMPDRYAHDPRFADIGARTRHIDEVYEILATILRTRTTAEWLALMEAADIPAVAMHTVETLLEDEHLRATGFFSFEEHPSEGRVRTMRTPSRWSATPPRHQRLAPRLGEHSAEVLAELGYRAEEIERLAAEGVTLLA